MKLLLALASFASYAFGGIVDCGGIFKITELSQSPDTYVRGGDNTTLTLKYDVPETWAPLQGTVTTSISINGIPFTPSTDDLCDSLTFKCPITHGSHDGSSWTTFPSGVTGKIVSKVVWKDTNNVQLLCLQSTFKAGAGTYFGGSVNMLNGITTAKPTKKHAHNYDLVPYYRFNEESSSSASGGSSSSGSGGSSSGSSSSGNSTSGSGRKLRGGK
jgi:hypothetical protein